MRNFAFVVVAFVFGLALRPMTASAADDTSWREWKHSGSMKLYEVVGRKWRIDVTNIKSSELVRYTEFKLTAAAKDNCTIAGDAHIYGKEPGKAAKWNKQSGETKLEFARLEDFSEPEWSYQGAELVKVKAGTFHCRKLQYLKKAARGSDDKRTYWASSAFRGLTVKSETDTETTELVSFETKPGDPVLTKDTAPNAKVATPAESPKNPSVAGERPVEADGGIWALYRRQGRRWTTKHTSNSSARTGTQIRHVTREVTHVSEFFCEYAERISDEKKQPLKSDDKPKRIDFTKANESMLGAPSDYTKVRDEKAKFAGKEWECEVYELKPKPGIDDVDTKVEMWLSKALPGLQLKFTSRSKYSDSVIELVEFDDGKPAPPRKLAVSQPVNVHSLKGRNWVMACTRVVGNDVTLTGFRGTVVIDAGTDSATVRTTLFDAERKQTKVLPDQVVAFAGGEAPPKEFYKLRKSEKLVAAGIEWQCKSYTGKIAAPDGGQNDVVLWYSDVYQGLVLREEITHADKSRNVAQIESLADQYSGPPQLPAPKEGEADFRLFTKVDRLWKIKHGASETPDVYNDTWTEYSIDLKVKSGWRMRIKRTYGLNFNRQHDVSYEVIDPDNADHNHRVLPPEGMKKVGEETIERERIAWDCYVYEAEGSDDQNSEKLWISKKYPGLHVKRVVVANGVKTWHLLCEFKE